MKLNTYLVFDGRCKEAFEFYQRSSAATSRPCSPTPAHPPKAQTPPEWLDKIMHARLTVDGSLLMGSDAPPDRYKTPHAFSVNIGTDDVAEAERIYAASPKAEPSTCRWRPTFWATRFGMFIDKFGIPWMINCPQTGGNS